MERAIIYYAKTGLEATDHFVPKLLEKYCNGSLLKIRMSHLLTKRHLKRHRKE